MRLSLAAGVLAPSAATRWRWFNVQTTRTPLGKLGLISSFAPINSARCVYKNRRMNGATGRSGAIFNLWRVEAPG